MPADESGLDSQSEQVHRIMTVAGSKQFTIASANRTLPLVRAIVSDIVELYKDVADRERRLRELRPRKRVLSRIPIPKSLSRFALISNVMWEKLQGFVNELHEIGVVFKDPVQGLVDFPARLNGDDVYLCWKLGESEVQFWHSLESGYAGRQPLNTSATEEESPLVLFQSLIRIDSV